MAKKILVVDDEVDVLKFIVYRLEMEDYEVVYAIDGFSALTVALRERPDLIFLDLKLPGMDGYEVCRRIKAEETLQHIPVIFITADVGIKNEYIRKARGEGYILKPFEAEDLINKAKEYLSKGTDDEEKSQT